jgi:predicted nucleic acid-binding protein
MNGLLLDTNILSEFNRSKPPHPNVEAWLSSVDTNHLYVSVIVLAEIRFGIERMPAGKRRTQLEDWLAVELYTWFENRILYVTDSIAQRWAVMASHRESRGRPLANFDGLIAATAAEYDLVLVTRNEADFADLNVPLLNPWS